MKVFVYFNLHKQCWSVRQNGRVIAHLRKVSLINCKLKVSKAGRERVLRERKKNVHAGVQGTMVNWLDDSICDKVLTYNPYKYTSFVRVEPPFTFPVYDADAVVMDVDSTNKVTALNPR